MRYLSALCIIAAACSGIACDGSPVGPTPVEEVEVEPAPEPINGFIWNYSLGRWMPIGDEDPSSDVTGPRLAPPEREGPGRQASGSMPWIIIRPVQEGGQAATQSGPWLIVRAEEPGQ